MDDLQYSFAAKPRAVQNARGKYRREKAEKRSNTVFNIMNDPRVARGSVYAAANSIHVKKETVCASPRMQNEKEPPKQQRKQTIYTPPITLQTYFPVDLEKNLIEQTPHVDEFDASTQTDEFLPNDKHKKPFVLKKTGKDASTEIAEEDQLFNFDKEVEPLLTVLVNKTMKQALCEVEREEELKNVAGYLEELQANKSIEAEAVRKLVEDAKQAYAMKQTEKQEQRKRLEEFEQLDRKIAASSMSRAILTQVMEDTYAALTEQGIFYDPVRRQVEQGFLTWIYDSADVIVKSKLVGQQILQDVVQGGLRQQLVLQRLVQCHDSKTMTITLDCKHKPYGIESIGPIPWSVVDGVALLEARVQTWMQSNVSTVVRPSDGYLVDVLLS